MANPTRVDITAARLIAEEGIDRFAYNDATGKRVTCQPNGNLSIGKGINLETGLDDEEISWLAAHRLGKTDTALSQYAWYPALDEPRGSVFLDVGFNIGVSGLLGFVKMISAARSQNWQAAHDALMDSKAARALPWRYEKLAAILLSGDA